MTTIDVTERQLRELFVAMAPNRVSDHLIADVVAGMAGVRQRPGWLVPTHLDPSPRPGSWSGSRRTLVIAAVAAATILAGLLILGGGSPRPPFGGPTPSPTATGGAVSPPTPPPVAILPGEPWILYERFTQLGGGLFAMRLDGSDDHAVLTGLGSRLKSADWSPDGLRVVFVDEASETMKIVGIDGSNPQAIAYCTLYPGCDHPAWSPDGTRIAFSRVENARASVGPPAVGVYVLDLATNEVTTVVRLGRPLLADVPRWSRDGTQLVIGVDQMDADAFETGAAVATVPATGGDPTYVTPFELFGYFGDWSLTADEIVFGVQVREAMASLPPDDAWNVFVVNADGSGQRQVTNVEPGRRIWFPTWSRDGTWILAADQSLRKAVRIDPTTGEITVIGGTDLARPALRPIP